MTTSAAKETFAARYVATRSLKRARGIVTFLGRDTVAGGEVVIKTIAPSAVPAGGWLQFEHEADVLARLRSILAWEKKGEPGSFLVREFVAGATLEERLQRGRLPVLDAIAVVRGVLDDLDRAHRHGVIHRDVKPTNIILADGPPPRGILVDFGVARSGLADESLFEQPVSAGYYVSPEQAGILERGVDQRSDLYAVGLVLYECVTGRRPFEAEHIGELLRQHLTAEPPALIVLSPDTPRALDQIMRRLLRKEPRDRYQTAAAAAADLEELARALARGEPDPNIVAGTHDQRLNLTEPAFVGREAEIAQLTGALARARDGHGRLALLEALSGGGKTWVLEELARRGARDTAWVLRGRGVDAAAQRPLQVLEGIVREIVAAARADAELGDRLRRELDEHAPALGVLPLLADLVSASPAGSLGPEATAEARLLPALATLLDALGTEARPAVVVIDDFQWADELTTKLLGYWQRARIMRGAGSHTLLVVAFRSEEVEEDHPLRRVPVETHIVLAPFGRAELRSVAESMAGPLPDDVVAVVSELSEGIPFMAAAVLHGLVESGALLPSPAGWQVDRAFLPKPQSGSRAAALLVRRLERFPATAQRLLSVGAVLGKAFDLESATALAGVTPREAIEAIELGRRRQVVWLEARGDRCVFVHDKLREALLSRLSAPTLRELHAKAARRIEGIDPENAFDLAYHYDAAGEHDRALPHALVAAERARAQHSLQISEEHYRIAARGAAHAERATLRRLSEGLGDVLMLRGSYDEAALHLERAASLADNDVARAELQGKLGELAFKRGDVRAAGESIEQALRLLGRTVPRTPVGYFIRLLFEVLVQTFHVLFPSLFVARRPLAGAGAGADLLACRLLSRLSYVYWFHRGKIHCLWSHLREMNLAERYAPTAELAQAYSEHAPVMTMLPWFSRGIAYAARSLAIREARGDVWGQGQSLNFYGVTLYASARFDECLERCGASVRLLARAGDRWEENTARWNMALALYRKGELKAAVDTAQAVHRAATELGDRQAVGIALGVWAKASGGRVPGELIDAALAQPVEDIHAYAEVMQAHALRLLREGRFPEAVEALTKADRRVTTAGLKQEYVAPIVPWLTTALRLELEATPAIAHARRVAILRRARHAAQRALRIAREYPNNLPQALRELGLLAAVGGDDARAADYLRRAAGAAAKQGARYEQALTLAALGRVGASAGWATAASDAAEAAAMLRELEAELEPAADADARPGTLALADRFATLVESGRSIAAALSADALYQRLANAGVALLRGERGLVLKVDADGAIAPPEPADAQTTAVLAPLARRAIAAGAPMTTGPGQDEMLALAGIKSALCAPVLSRGRVAACFCAIHTGVADLFAEDEKRLAQFVTTLAGAALENAEGFAELAVANRERELGLLALNDVQKQLAVAGRMATVGTLAAGVAHEINNPLQYVITNVTVVGEELCALEQALAELAPAARTELRGSVTTMQQAIVDASVGAARVRQIVRDLRTFTRDANVRTPVDVRRVLDSVVSIARAEIHHRARLIRAYEDVPPVLANEARLGQVFLNVLVNAAQAIPEGDSERNEIRVRTRSAGGNVIIEVTDTGSGISPEVVERVFDPFFTTKPLGQGMGLGLSICHGIVTGAGGSIEVDSKLGRGTTMRIVLPAMAGTDGAAAAEPRPSSAEPTPRGFVVVIDDEPLVSEAISGLIAREHAVAVAHDGASGIELVLSLTAEIDVILCDLMMPRMSGGEVYAELRRRRPGMEEKLVFMTGGAFTAAAREFLESVSNLCLEKPIDGAALREHIRALVAARARR